MTAAEATVRVGGVIIMLAASDDGTGGEHFYHTLADEKDTDKTRREIAARGREQTIPDQWQPQILLRILKKATVIYVSNMPDDTVKAMHTIPSKSIDEAIMKAKNILNQNKVKITAIPEGVSVIVI